MAPSFEYKGVTYLHTESQWHSRTNRHTTTAGHSWGWIDGPRASNGDYCWSDDPGSRFTSSDAADVIRFHNEWLKEQEPIAIRLVKAHRQLASIEDRYRDSEEKLRTVSEELDEARANVASLETRQPKPATA